MASINYNQLEKKLLDTAYEAGEILLDFQKKRHDLKTLDKGVEGVATEADLASERFIISELKSTIISLCWSTSMSASKLIFFSI